MKPGHESRTAIIVCMGRAIAHATRLAPRFDDPTALALLPNKDRARVERFLAKAPMRSPRERIAHAFLWNRAKRMVVRTVAIDDAIRAAPRTQVVLLGAGLDGRAFRMDELSDSIVFEVDHPDSQRAKRARTVVLEQRAREVRFVPVDFTRDDLDRALADAGHDPTVPTVWVWEGVVMYLTLEQIVATLSIVSRRSARASQLLVAYLRPSLAGRVVGFGAALLGERFQSAQTPDEMRALLAKHGWRTLHDDGLRELVALHVPKQGRVTDRMSPLRLIVGERTA